MVRHIVMFKFLPEAEGRSALENAKIAKDMLEALPEKIPCIVWSKISINTGKDENYELVLEADYKTFEDLAFYTDHPDHKKVGKFIKGVRLSRACVDYEY